MLSKKHNDSSFWILTFIDRIKWPNNSKQLNIHVQQSYIAYHTCSMHVLRIDILKMAKTSSILSLLSLWVAEVWERFPHDLVSRNTSRHCMSLVWDHFKRSLKFSSRLVKSHKVSCFDFSCVTVVKFLSEATWYTFSLPSSLIIRFLRYPRVELCLHLWLNCLLWVQLGGWCKPHNDWPHAEVLYACG